MDSFTPHHWYNVFTFVKSDEPYFSVSKDDKPCISAAWLMAWLQSSECSRDGVPLARSLVKFGLHAPDGVNWLVSLKELGQPEWWIAQTYYEKICTFLLSRTKRVPKLCAYDNGAIRHAATHGHLSVCRFIKGMRSQDVTIEALLNDVRVLKEAAENGQFFVCQFLWQWMTVTIHDNHEAIMTATFALPYASSHGNLALCSWLLECSAILKTSNPGSLISKSGSLTSAAGHGHLEVCKLFLSHMSLEDVRNENCSGKNFALLAAVKGGHLAVCQYLKDWRDKNGLGLTIHDTRQLRIYDNLLQPAAEHGHVHILQFLKDWWDPDNERLTINDVRASKASIIRLAARGGHLAVLRFLKEWRDTTDAVHLKNGKDGVKDPDDRSLKVADVAMCKNRALVLAVDYGHLEVCKFLRDWRDPGSFEHLKPDNVGQLLLCAVRAGHVDVCEFLKNWLATNLSVRDIFTYQLLQVAAMHGHVNVCRFFKHWLQEEPVHPELEPGGANSTSLIKMEHRGAIRNAIECGHIDVCQFLEEWFGHDMGISPKDVECSLNNDPAEVLFVKAAATKNGLAVCQWFKRWLKNTGDDLTEAEVGHALKDAAANSDLELCRWLLYDCGISLSKSYVLSALQCAAGHGTVDMCRLFQEWLKGENKGLTLDDLRSDDNLVLRMAVTQGNVKVCKFLRQWGLTLADACSINALTLAVDAEYMPVCRFLRAWSKTAIRGEPCQMVQAENYSALRKAMSHAVLECRETIYLKLCLWLIDWAQDEMSST